MKLEDVLTVSAKEYCESKGKQLSDYRLVGVAGGNGEPAIEFLSYGRKYESPSPFFTNFISDAPPGTEAIVEVRLYKFNAQYIYFFHGTGLIPKKKRTSPNKKAV